MRLVRAGAAALAIVAIAVGLPLALVRFAAFRPGLPTSEQLADLPDLVLSDTAIWRVLTVAAWAVWAVLVVSLVWELVTYRPHRPLPPIRFGALQRLARHLVQAALLTATVATPLVRPAPADAVVAPAATAPMADRPLVPLATVMAALDGAPMLTPAWATTPDAAPTMREVVLTTR